MIVFKKYFKVFIKYLPQMIAYMAILAFISMFIYKNGDNNVTGGVELKDVKTTIVNHDDSPITKNFTKFVKDKTEYVHLEDDDESLKDALFFQKVHIVIIIPENYSKDVLAGKDVHITTLQVPDSYAAKFSEQIMNQYLNTSYAYANNNVDSNKINAMVKKDIGTKAKVVDVQDKKDDTIRSARFYFDFTNYSILAALVMTVATVMAAYNNEKISNRNKVSPITYQSMNRQLLLGNLCLTLMVMALIYGIAFWLFGEKMLTINGLLYFSNVAIFSFVALLLAFLISKFTTKREVISGVVNVIALGTSFIGGCFVPREFLNDFIITISKVTPTYWLVDANERISTLTKYTMTDIMPILKDFGILVIFMVIIYVAIQVFSRMKVKS